MKMKRPAIRRVTLFLMLAMDAISAPGPPAARGDDSRTPLHLAARRTADADIVTALVKAKADPKAADENGWTPLHHVAWRSRNPDTVTALVEAGADPDAVGGQIMRSQPMIVLTLVVLLGGSATSLGGSAPADSGAGCAEWNTESFFKKASVEEVSACLEAGADPKSRDEKGRIPLILAAAHTRHPGVIAALIQAGADFRAVGRRGESPLHVAAASNESRGVIAALLDAGANPRAGAPGRHGETPVEMAAGSNTNPDVLNTLLQAGGDPKKRDWSPVLNPFTLSIVVPAVVHIVVK